MSDLTITHTPAEGTMLDGTSRGDGVNLVLRAAPMQWKWSRNLGQFYVQRSRDRVVPDKYGIEQTAEALRAAGHTVTVEVGADTRPVEEREQDREERNERRIDMLENRAERKTGEADAAFNAEHAILDHIPAGQPILVDHYSAPRHRRALERADGHMRRGIEAHKGAKDAAYGAKAAEASQRHRESLPATLRRIEKLEADERKFQRTLDGYERHANIGDRRVLLEQHEPATGEHRTRVEALLSDAQAQLRYWREQVEQMEAAGAKVWSRADFERGDWVAFRFGWSPVKRVNPKSVTIPDPEPRLAANGRTWTVSYDDVRGRRAKADAADLVEKFGPDGSGPTAAEANQR